VGPTPIEEQIQPILPKYLLRPITRTRTRTRIRTIQEPTPISEPVTIPIHIMRAIPSIPNIEKLTGEPRPMRYRRESIRKKRLGSLDLLRMGEVREYDVKLPEELLKGL